MSSSKEFINIKRLTEQGNRSFDNKQYDEAVKLYSQAIKLCLVPMPVLFYNRSSAYSALGDAENALDDACIVIALNPEWSFGYLRKGNALEAFGKYQEAIIEYEEGLKLEKGNEKLLEFKKKAAKKVFSMSTTSFNLPSTSGYLPSTSGNLPSTSADLPSTSDEDKAAEDLKVAFHIFKKGRYMESAKYFNSSIIRNRSSENVKICSAKIRECFLKEEALKKGANINTRRSRSPSEVKREIRYG